MAFRGGTECQDVIEVKRQIMHPPIHEAKYNFTTLVPLCNVNSIIRLQVSKENAAKNVSQLFQLHLYNYEDFACSCCMPFAWLEM